eukprot:GHUV01049558.1.p1 GENE.GHUV01049558.1~~GHUV01049558.1.p1  ORF type:complete len:191 (-),score=34.29 GHUV01049558.1:365-937(-)
MKHYLYQSRARESSNPDSVFCQCLQLGQCSANLQGLLRQGQESSEIVIEAPVLQPDSSGPLFAGVAEQQEVQAHEPVQLGVLVLRLINIGREPSNAAARTPDFNAVQPEPKASGKKVSTGLGPSTLTLNHDIIDSTLNNQSGVQLDTRAMQKQSLNAVMYRLTCPMQLAIRSIIVNCWFACGPMWPGWCS